MNDRHVISPYPIRMPSELRQRLEESAKQGARSLHAEIISRLEASYDPEAFIDLTAGVASDPELSRDKMILSEVKEIKEHFQLFQEMMEILKAPPTAEQIAWAEKMVTKIREEKARSPSSSKDIYQVASVKRIDPSIPQRSKAPRKPKK
jgi:hypothetical protein